MAVTISDATTEYTWLIRQPRRKETWKRCLLFSLPQIPTPPASSSVSSAIGLLILVLLLFHCFQVTIGVFGHEEKVIYEPLTPAAIQVLLNERLILSNVSLTYSILIVPTTNSLHLFQVCAARCVSPQVNFTSVSSAMTVWFDRRVIFLFPLFTQKILYSFCSPHDVREAVLQQEVSGKPNIIISRPHSLCSWKLDSEV